MYDESESDATNDHATIIPVPEPDFDGVAPFVGRPCTRRIGDKMVTVDVAKLDRDRNGRHDAIAVVYRADRAIAPGRAPERTVDTMRRDEHEIGMELVLGPRWREFVGTGPSRAA